MKTFVRLIALILACLTCLCFVVACDGGDDDNGSGSGYDPTKDENGRLKDDLPDDLNYLGTEITTLYWEDVEHPEYESETITGDNVMDAIYERNDKVQNRLNVQLKWDKTPGNYTKRTAFIKKVENIKMSGTHDYDFLSAYSRTVGTLGVQGYLTDIKDIEDSYINYEQPWWPKALVDTVSIGDSVYFISGDISTNVLHMMYTLYFNKDMLNKLYNKDAQNAGFSGDEAAKEQLYDWVYKGEWTLDKLIELCSGVYSDKDGSVTRTDGDIYGFGSVNYHLDAFYTGANMRYVEADKDEILVIAPEYGSKKTVTLVSKMGQFLAQEDCWVGATDSEKNTEGSFKQGNMLFIQNRTRYAEWHLLDSQFDYGLVPTPKYDDKQINYYSVCANPFSLYGIFSDCAIRADIGNGDQQSTWQMLSAVLECWCSEGYRLTTPEIFEVNMQLKYSETQDETNMFEEVRAAITFDIGRIFSDDLSYINDLPSQAMRANASWSTSYAAYKRVLNKQMAEIVTQLREYGTAGVA